VRLAHAQSSVRSVDPKDWKIDSSRALATFLEEGGRIFLEQYPGSDVRVSLLVLPGGSHPVWLVSGIAPQTKAVETLTLHAGTGQVLSVQRARGS
jgi:hypothetical protein